MSGHIELYHFEFYDLANRLTLLFFFCSRLPTYPQGTNASAPGGKLAAASSREQERFAMRAHRDSIQSNFWSEQYTFSS